MSATTPLPCPYCGSTEFDIADNDRFFEWIVCGNCQATGPTAAFGQAVAAWNHRAETAGGRPNDGDPHRSIGATVIIRYRLENVCTPQDATDAGVTVDEIVRGVIYDEGGAWAIGGLASDAEIVSVTPDP